MIFLHSCFSVNALAVRLTFRSCEFQAKGGLSIAVSIEGRHPKMTENAVTFKIGETHSKNHPKVHICSLQKYVD